MQILQQLFTHTQKQALPFLIDGLKKLEYRGYDSAGVCIKKDSDFFVVKNKGKVCGSLEVLFLCFLDRPTFLNYH